MFSKWSSLERIQTRLSFGGASVILNCVIDSASGYNFIPKSAADILVKAAHENNEGTMFIESNWDVAHEEEVEVNDGHGGRIEVLGKLLICETSIRFGNKIRRSFYDDYWLITKLPMAIMGLDTMQAFGCSPNLWTEPTPHGCSDEFVNELEGQEWEKTANKTATQVDDVTAEDGDLLKTYAVKHRTEQEGAVRRRMLESFAKREWTGARVANLLSVLDTKELKKLQEQELNEGASTPNLLPLPANSTFVFSPGEPSPIPEDCSRRSAEVTIDSKTLAASGSDQGGKK